VLRDLASLIVSVAGESVSMVKRSAPEHAATLKRQQEWDIYLEFVQVMFNLADRLAAFHIPVREQPVFMDELEAVVGRQLKDTLEPILGPDSDDMAMTVTIGKTVADSRARYERFRFTVTEDSPMKAELFKLFAERVAGAMGCPGNGMVLSAATLCASAVIPAMTAVFQKQAGGAATEQQQAEQAPASKAGDATPTKPAGSEIKLVSVMSAVEGDEVETRWGLHPRFRLDLRPDEAKELSRLMNRVTRILGERYAAVAFTEDWAIWHHTGNA
jgi:hypothetical protein